MKKRSSIQSRVLAAMFAVSFANAAMAESFWWTGAEDRSFGTPANWRISNATTGSVATKAPSSDTVRFMAYSGSTSIFSDRFINDGYVVEFDKAYTNTWQFFVNTSDAKVTWKGTSTDSEFTFTRPAYNTRVYMGIGETTNSTLRIEDMVYTHSYTNLVLGWTSGMKGNLEIASGATVNIPSTAGWCDGLCLRHGSSLLIDGGTLDCAKNVTIGWATGSNSTGVNVISNINGTVTAARFVVGGKNRHGQYVQKGGSLTTTGNIVLADNWTNTGSSYFEVDGGTVTAGGATTNQPIYVGYKGYAATPVHMVVKGDSEVKCYTLAIGWQSSGVLDIEGGLVSCRNECILSSEAGGANYNDDLVRHPRLNLLGGVLETPRVKSNSTNAYATVFFNGGTLRERTNNDTIIKDGTHLYVKVGANGGMIDTNGLTTRLPKTIETGVDEGTDGGMTFTGGGTLALQSTASLAYTGDTKVSSDTTLSVTDKSKVDLDKFVCLVNSKPEEGHAILKTTGNDAFTATDLARIRLADGRYPASSVRLKLSSDGKSILCKSVEGLTITFY